MKFDIKILWIKDIMNHIKGDVTEVSINLEQVSDHIELLLEIENQIGDLEEGEDFEIIDEAQFWTKAHAAAAGNDKLDDIRAVLCKFFEEHSNGDRSEDFDPDFCADDAIDEIADIVGHY